MYILINIEKDINYLTIITQNILNTVYKLYIIFNI
jgi:hypothetical protein